MVPFWRGERRRPQPRPGPGHRARSCASWPSGSTQPDCLDWLRARVLPRRRGGPQPARITSAGSCAAPAALPTDRTLRDRGVARSARRLAGDPAQPVRQPAAPGPAAGAGGPAAAAARLSAAVPAPRRRRPHPPDRHRRAGARPVRRPDAGERRGADPRRAGRQRPVRPALPPERGAGAAAAARPGRQAGARCGCSGCAAATCCRSPGGIPTSPSSSRRSANACTTTSTCRACSSCWPTSATGHGRRW